MCPEEQEPSPADVLVEEARGLAPGGPIAVLCDHIIERYKVEGRTLFRNGLACREALHTVFMSMASAAEVEKATACVMAARTAGQVEGCIDLPRPAKPPLEVTVQELTAAYAANELAAATKYEGRKVIVSGVIDRVTKGFREVNIIIRPEGRKRRTIERVQYKVPPEHLKDAAEARPGEPIKAGGCVTGNMMGQVFIEPCDD